MRGRFMSRLFLRALLAAFVVSVIGAGTGTAAPGNSADAVTGAEISTSSYRASAEECKFLSLINNYRKQNGRGALVMTRTLGAAAEHHSADMANTSVFSHTLSNGTSWSQNMSNHGYTYNTYRGENIAAGNVSADKTFVQWKNSPGHNANMLNKNFKAMGVGQVSNSSSKYKSYWTNVFGGYVDQKVSC